ncbi:MAG: hypothetical protein ACI9WV_001775 [Patiriisocius sp.]|jgi:hypothetical protein
MLIYGNSTNGIKEYFDQRKDEFSVLISENDQEQYHAIQKSISIAIREVVS